MDKEKLEQMKKAADAIHLAYAEFVEKIQPGIDYYVALGKRAEDMRKENEKLPLY